MQVRLLQRFLLGTRLGKVVGWDLHELIHPVRRFSLATVLSARVHSCIATSKLTHLQARDLANSLLNTLPVQTAI